MSDFIEWKKDRISINQNKISNYVLTAAKDLVILNGNSSLNGVYNCVVDNEIISSYSITFKQSKYYKVCFHFVFILIFFCQASSSAKNQMVSGNQREYFF